MQNGDAILGAIVGDIAGSRFEWCNLKSKDFTLLVGRGENVDECCFTDDTVMTVAIAEAILKWRKGGDKSYEALSLIRTFPMASTIPAVLAGDLRVCGQVLRLPPTVSAILVFSLDSGSSL